MSARIASVISACAAMAALAVGVVFGTYVAGGSDSSCYLNAARLLSQGRVVLEQALVREAPWPSPAETFTPAGFTPSAVDPARLVPICSPGLPLVMALFRLLRVSEFLVVPLLGALAVWLTYRVGRAIDRPGTGAAAAVLLACSPTFLYQVVQPMSDVPAAAWWLLAMVLVLDGEEQPRRPALAGLASSLALVTRPNLLPLAGVIAAYLLVTRRGPGRVAGLAAFAAGLLPGVVILALLQRAMYGSPLSTGYGRVDSLMGVSHVLPNLQRYVEWLIGAHTPFLLLALAAPFVVPQPRRAWLCLAIAATTLGCYLPYIVFDDWWYTRFLLPAIPLLLALATATLVALAGRFAGIARVALPVACVVALAVLSVRTARSRHAFDFAEMEQHYSRAGSAVASHVPDTAVIVTVKNSGSVQYHAGRPIVSWDVLDAASLDEALAFVRARGRTPYLLFEIDEEPAFRARFSGASVIGNLDWPPRVQVGRSIRLYDPADRDRYLADGRVRTEFVQEAPAPSHDWRRWFRVVTS